MSHSGYDFDNTCQQIPEVKVCAYKIFQIFFQFLRGLSTSPRGHGVPTQDPVEVAGRPEPRHGRGPRGGRRRRSTGRFQEQQLYRTGGRLVSQGQTVLGKFQEQYDFMNFNQEMMDEKFK